MINPEAADSGTGSLRTGRLYAPPRLSKGLFFMVKKIYAGDRYHPCVLSRLSATDTPDTDLSPEEYFRKHMEEDVLANLRMLFSSRMHPRPEEIDKWPDAKTSVVCYGLSDFCGLDNSPEIFEMVKKEIAWQIRCFEPRLNPNTLIITRFEDEKSDHCSFSLHIEARFAIESISDDFSCNFYMELETGRSIINAEDS